MSGKPKKPLFLWTSEKIRILIEFLQNNEFLYNPKSELYKDKEKRELKFRDVAEFIGCSVYEAKDKWQKLRTYYNKEHSKAKSKSSGMGTGEVYTPKWEFYSSMLFLTSSFETAPSTSNLDFEIDGKVYSKHEEPENDIFQEEIVEEFEDEAVVPENSPTPKKKKKQGILVPKNQNPWQLKKNELMESCINLLKAPIPQNDKVLTADELFGLHLAHMITPLSPKRKDYVKIKLMETAYEYVYQESYRIDAT